MAMTAAGLLALEGISDCDGTEAGSDRLERIRQPYLSAGHFVFLDVRLHWSRELVCSLGVPRAAFSSLSAAALGALSVPAGFSTALPADFAAALLCSGFLLALTGCFAGAAAVGFAAGWGAGFAVCAEGFAAAVGAGFAGACAAGLAAVGEAGLAGVCEAGLAGVCVEGFAGSWCACFAGGFEACCAACAPCPATESPVAGGSGFICARKRGAAAPIKSPSPSVITERIVRLFPLRVSQPRCQAWLPLQEPHRNQQAW